MRRASRGSALAGWFPLSRLRRVEGLAACLPARPDLRLHDLRQGDLGRRRHGDAPRAPAAQRLFWAAFLMATHSNGMSAMQLKSELGLGSSKTAWLSP